ncbi:ANTAR domain-containing protein [Actinophytocola glycyrrhizae]|uniref:ANTAR domain-containing protein n=1 Tax=Actinophytocola glycyrrhizae TaxID=2044873 RepID=A0ABV9S945_9PSEU
MLDGQRRQRLWRAIAAGAEAPGEDGWAQAVCLACVAALPGADAAILALRDTARAHEILGASDSWAAELAVSQYTVGEGPGVEAFTTGGPVLVPDMRVEQERWPGFADAARAAGAEAAFAFPLQLGAIKVGTLEFFRHRAGSLASNELSDAVLAADLATTGLVRQARDAEQDGREFAPRPVTSFQDVNIATGMLAAQLRIGLDDAFIRLRGHAFAKGRSVLDVARDVLEQRIPLDELAQ